HDSPELPICVTMAPEGCNRAAIALGSFVRGLGDAGLSITSEESRMLDQPQIVETDARDTAVIRLTVSREQIGDVMGPAFAEVMDALITQGIEPTGPFFSHHFRMDPEVFDLEVGVPVATPVAETGRVEP